MSALLSDFIGAALGTPETSRPAPDAQDDTKEYGTPANVANRIELHIARHGRKNTTTLLLYEAMKALRAPAAGAAQAAAQKAEPSEGAQPATSAEPFGYLDCFGIFYRKKVFAEMTPVFAQLPAAAGDAQVAAYALPDGIRVERAAQFDGGFLWAVRRDGNCLGRDGEWSYEPLPSSRSDAWLALHRFVTAAAAIDAALAAQVPQQGEA